MVIFIIICFLFVSGYTVLMMQYRRGWHLQQQFALPGHYAPSTSISIIIAARNEEKNIATCVNSILAQNYPADLFEIIVIDDHSSDNTAGIVRGYTEKNVHYICLADHLDVHEPVTGYKKKAIATGINNSKGELILTTDADCIAPPDWLRYIAACYEKEKPVMVIAPVDFTCNDSIVQLFQSIDFMTMQGITAAAHQLKMGNMSNGANLAFSRVAYEAVDGYQGIDHLASGDDYLLMMKLQKNFPGRISYLKSPDAIIKTAPQPGWKDFLQQRIRWASKSGKYDDKKLTVILLLVYLFNLSFLILLITAFFNPVFWGIIFIMLLWKILAELFFIVPVSAFFYKRQQLKWYVVLQPLHIAYIISAGFLGFIGVYQWKGRRTK